MTGTIQGTDWRAEGGSTLREWARTQGWAETWARGSRSDGLCLSSLEMRSWAPTGTEGGNFRSTCRSRKKKKGLISFTQLLFPWLPILSGDLCGPHNYILCTPSPTKPQPDSWGQPSHLDDAPVCFIVRSTLKGRVSHQQLVAEDADAPQVHLFIVHAPLNHLWRQVVQGAAHCLPPGWGREWAGMPEQMACPSPAAWQQGAEHHGCSRGVFQPGSDRFLGQQWGEAINQSPRDGLTHCLSIATEGCVLE